MPQRPLAAVVTLGCKLNLADSDGIARRLTAAGYDVVDRLCEADAVVINTCSITHVADRKARRLIRSARRVAPAAALAVTGCYPRTAGAVAVVTLGADFVAGTRDEDRAGLVAFLQERLGAAGPLPSPAAAPARHTRAFISAQEGCNDVCSFCIVPRTRGRERSRAPGEVVAAVAMAAVEGAREAVITGTQLGAWGRDFATPARPHQLIAAILEGTDIPRLRFSSLQPQDITPEMLALWSDPRLMPHFHLALQSGSEATLKTMRRRYGAADFLAAAERIHAAVPGAAITTDVIAGFPGETEAGFADTLDLAREVAFARIHAFPYSARTGTAAARLPDQLDAGIIRERMTRLIALGDELASAFQSRFRGTVRPVLWESQREVDGRMLWSGYTDNYIPAYAEGDGLANRVTAVRLGEPLRDGLLATTEVAAR